MITGFEQITEELSDKEKSLLPFVEKALNKFTTRENAIKSGQLCGVINLMYAVETGERSINLEGQRLRKLINYIRKNSILPVIATSDGYFVSYKREEIEKQIKSLKERASGILDAAKGLEAFLK